MNLSNFLYIAALTSAADNATSDCPCFTREEIAKITEDTMNMDLSCIPDPNGLEEKIWQNTPEPPAGKYARVAPGRAIGYEVHGGDDPKCLIQGDMIMSVSLDQALACKQLIAEQCVTNNAEGYDEYEM